MRLDIIYKKNKTVNNENTWRLNSTFLNNEQVESESCLIVSNSFWPHGLYSPWNSLGENTGVGSLSLLQGIIPTQGSNPGLLHCRQILYHLIYKGSSRILEWVAYPFSSGSSWPRNWTGVSCIAGRFFTNWAIREPWYWKVTEEIKREIKKKNPREKWQWTRGNSKSMGCSKTSF